MKIAGQNDAIVVAGVAEIRVYFEITRLVLCIQPTHSALAALVNLRLELGPLARGLQNHPTH